jgi:hypothetical protein
MPRRVGSQEGKTYPRIVNSTGLVNHFYFYCVDGDFGPFLLKFRSYFPYNAKLPSAPDLARSASACPTRHPVVGRGSVGPRVGRMPSGTAAATRVAERVVVVAGSAAHGVRLRVGCGNGIPSSVCVASWSLVAASASAALRCCTARPA